MRGETIRKTITCLRTQTVRDRIEIIIVAPSADKLVLNESDLQPFHSVRVAEIGDVMSLAHGNAAGVRVAAAPIVAMLEDHSYPDPKWAENILAAVEKSKASSLERLLFALGIRDVGESTAKILAKFFGSLEALMQADETALLEVPGAVDCRFGCTDGGRYAQSGPPEDRGGRGS